jgi:hypothetical protein
MGAKGEKASAPFCWSDMADVVGKLFGSFRQAAQLHFSSSRMLSVSVPRPRSVDATDLANSSLRPAARDLKRSRQHRPALSSPGRLFLLAYAFPSDPPLRAYHLRPHN